MWWHYHWIIESIYQTYQEVWDVMPAHEFSYKETNKHNAAEGIFSNGDAMKCEVYIPAFGGGNISVCQSNLQY